MADKIYHCRCGICGAEYDVSKKSIWKNHSYCSDKCCEIARRMMRAGDDDSEDDYDEDL